MKEQLTAIVTGGSSGIGEATALSLKEQGYNVFVFDLMPCNNNFNYISVDIRDEKQIIDAMSSIPQVDLLVNCAGVYYLKYVTDMTKDELDKIVDTNFKGTFLMCKHCLPKIINTKGNIINVSSGLGIAPELSSPAYCATKSAIIMLTKCLAQEYATIPVRVNCVLPGPIDTPMLRKSCPTEEEYNAYRLLNPMKTVGDVQDVANVISFLASNKAKYITGGIYAVDGGESTSSTYSK